ncbi:MAG: hypothetical protein AAF358_20635 [Pseudomonadota bacterium]
MRGRYRKRERFQDWAIGRGRLVQAAAKRAEIAGVESRSRELVIVGRGGIGGVRMGMLMMRAPM